VKEIDPDQSCDPASGNLLQDLPTRVLLILVAVIAAADQLTKVLANTNLEYGVNVPVFPGFDLLLAFNRGAAFSFLNDASGWQRWLLSGISLSVSVFLLVWLVQLPRKQRLLRVALAVILGGAIGNLYDRMMYGYVVDFISVYYQQWRFATFNIADAAISIGAVLLGWDVLTSQSDKAV